MRLLAWLFASDKSWLKESLAYHERSNRHMDSLDPNHWNCADRSSAGNVQEKPVEKINPRRTVMFHGVVNPTRTAKSEIARLKAAGANTHRVSSEWVQPWSQLG
ncbi:Uncharacterised protein [uncultured archaeon]|nr:Uncharacterised protein [uncultured archaeon]